MSKLNLSANVTICLKKKKKEGFKNQEKKLKIIQLVLLAPNEMKLRTKLVSNRKQTKIQVSLSPPCPSPHPTHQQQMRNTAKARCAVFCSKTGPDPGSMASRLRPVGHCARDAFSYSSILHGWWGDFQTLLGALLFSSSPAIS